MITEGDKTSAMSLEQLIRHLHINVMSKKNKNVEVLHLAAEVGLTYPGLMSHDPARLLQSGRLESYNFFEHTNICRVPIGISK